MIDYHLHTLFCNHALGSMERYIQSAAGLGLVEICFLDHLTVQPADKGLSMSLEEVPYYFQAVQVLKQKYRHSIQIKAGLEIDFNPDHTGLFQEVAGTYAFDIIATGLHFPGGVDVVSRRSPWRWGEKNADYVYGHYFEQLEKMLDYTYFDVICHIDLVKKFGRKPSRCFERAVDEILSKIKEKNLTVEVNTSGFNHPIQKPYPSLDIIRKCHEKGIRITLGSDAHKPEDVGQHYERALPMILSAGYRHLATFTKRKRSEIPIKKRENIPYLNELTDSNDSK
jgi:histidinol-phosphatase (PHP family)